MIGDNLSTHLSPHVIELCEKYDITFVFLPPNSTFFLQPLDVSVFSPMKTAWRKILETWKFKNFRRGKCMPKTDFPQQLNILL